MTSLPLQQSRQQTGFIPIFGWILGTKCCWFNLLFAFLLPSPLIIIAWNVSLQTCAKSACLQLMSSTLPKPLLGGKRSSFALIDPATQIYHRNRHGLLTNSIRQHVAISYVWSEWVDSASGGLPNWNAIRGRLFFIVGEGASMSIRAETGGATRCWLDSKCIDQSSEISKSYWIPRMDEI